MEEDTVHKPIIQVSSGITLTGAVTIPYEFGSFKEIQNYNKTLDTAELKTVSTQNETMLSLLKDGSFVWIDGTMKYIINTSKKVREHRKGGVTQWNAYITMISLTVILQKCVMPNKSIRHPIDEALPMKTVKSEIEKIVELYAPQYKGYTNWTVNYPDALEVCDEFTWTQPTLYEAICELCSDANYVPAVVFNGTNFVINFIDTTTSTGTQFDTSNVNGFEVSHSLENNPQRMVNIIQNNISSQTIKEYNVYQKSKIGVYDDTDESTFLSTEYPINRPIKVYAKANLPQYESPDQIGGGVSGHNAGFYKIDITPYVIEKTLFDALPFDKDKIPTSSTDNNFRNAHLYFEKGKQNIEALLLTYKGVFNNIISYNLTYMLQYIMNYDETLILNTAGIPVDTGLAQYIIRPEDAKYFVFDVEYETVASLRYDIEKSDGYGSIVQNQNGAFISFDNYRKQQKDLINRMGFAEEVLMGRVYDPAHLPQRGMLYGSKLIAQTTHVWFLNHINFMCVATSMFNRIDGDAVINTRKRFWSIVPAEESVERNEFYNLPLTITDFTNVVSQATHILMTTYDSNNNILKETFLSFIKQQIDDNTYLFSSKTLDNKFAGLRVRDDGAIRYVEGVFYTSELTGEFHHAKLTFVDLSVVSNMDYWKDYPQKTIWLSPNYYSYLDNVLKYKDVAEKIAFSILVKKV